MTTLTGTVNDVDRMAQEHGQVITAPADATVCEAAKCMHENSIGSIVVVDANGEVAGIITERDIINKVVATGGDPENTPVSEVMSDHVVSCHPTTPIGEAERTMAHYGIRHLPILRGGKPVGMISSRDILARQLADTREVLQRQYRLLHHLEVEHPGITRLDRDDSGRIVI